VKTSVDAGRVRGAYGVSRGGMGVLLAQGQIGSPHGYPEHSAVGWRVQEGQRHKEIGSVHTVQHCL